MTKILNTDKARFWAKVRKGPGCWEWQAMKNKDGYGRFYFRGKLWTAHRFSYVLTNGEIEDHLDTCHSCDNKSCVRPSHLWAGTRSQNVQDAYNKGLHGSVQGEDQLGSKLRESDVQFIRKHNKRYKRGGWTQAKLAEMFGVHQATISLVLTRKKWRHV